MIPSRHFLAPAILIAGVLWAPLPAASVTPLGELVVRLICLAAGIAAIGSRTGRSLSPALLPAAALLSLAFLGLVQSSPWPPSLARSISPEHYRLATEAAEVLQPEARGEIERVYLSLAPGKSRSVAVTLCCVAAALVAAFAVGRSRGRRRWLALAVVAAGLLQLVLGAKAFAGGSVPRLRGTFVNPDHLANLLQISLAVCFVWVVAAIRRGRRQSAIIPLERRLVEMSAPVLAWLFLFAGLSFTGSRAGLAAALAGAAVQALLLGKTLEGASAARLESRRRWLPGLPLLAALAMGATAVIWVALQAGFARVLATSRYEILAAERFRVWVDSLALSRRFPLLGSGLGSFRETFEQIQPAGSNLTWTRAHNDYVELLLTTGLAGLAIALVGSGALALALWRAVSARARFEDRLAALAGCGVIVSLALHATFDFGVTLPATSFIAAVVLGAALSPGASRRPTAVKKPRFRRRSPEGRHGPEPLAPHR